MTLKLYSKPRRRKLGPEAQLQCAVVQYLQLAGVPGLLFFSVPNEQKCSVQRGAMLKKMGRLAGVSDLVVMIPKGRWGFATLFLELKARGEKATESQNDFQMAVSNLGPPAVYKLADNIDDALRILKDCGAIRTAYRRRSPFAEAA